MDDDKVYVNAIEKPKVWKDPIGRAAKISAAHKGKPKNQNQLRALRAGAVPAGKALNPYGSYGNTYRSRYRLGDLDHLSWRPEAMKRKRLKLKAQKARALEAHELQLKARENSDLAMNTLIEIAGNTRAPEATRIAAATAIMDRGYGKASQTSITASVSGGKASDLNADELDKRTQQALKRVEELTNRTRKAGPGKKAKAGVVHNLH